MTRFDQFKQSVNALNHIKENDLSSIASFNTPTYDAILSTRVSNLIEESQDGKVEDYLIEIRKLWLSHLINLDFIRNVYSALGYKKLPRPLPFDEIGKPAYMELYGSVTPDNSKYIEFDKKQILYWHYLEYVKKHEGAMIYLDQLLSKELGVKTNFENIDDMQPGFMNHKCNLGSDFMIDPVKEENHERIKEIKEAEAYISSKLNDVYSETKPEYYEWLIKSILKYPFPEVVIPDVKQNELTFVVAYQGSKKDLYNKIRQIKRQIYPPRRGSEALAKVFNDSTKNFKDKRVLKSSLLKGKM